MMKTNERDDIEDLKGPLNGALHFYVVRDSEHWRSGNFLEIGFDDSDWRSLFNDVLGCPTWDPYIEGEDINQYYERGRAKFQQSISQYPMLSRIWDLYQDVSYTAEEVRQLREECLRVKASTSNSLALRALRKLIFACDEALKIGQGLFFASD